MRATRKTETTGGSCKLAALAALLCLWNCGASAQQSGTMFSQSVTFASSATAEVDVLIAGPKAINTASVVMLEFGPDGSAATGVQSVPDGARFVLSNGGVTKTFTPAGGDGTQPFPGKQVDFSRPDAASLPNLFSLAVIHLTPIPGGASEQWKLSITGLPPVGLRANGSVSQGTFVGLAPLGVAQGPVIRILSAPVAAGTSPSFAIGSSPGFDLSNVGAAQVTIDPSDGISNLRVTGATAGALATTFDISPCTFGGDRTLTIRSGLARASAPFAVTAALQVAAITLSQSRVKVGTSTRMTVSSSPCFDLSGVALNQVSINPSDGLSAIGISNVTPRSFALSFSVAEAAATGSRTVTVRTSAAAASATFTVFQIHQCSPNEQCCRRGPDGGCAHCTTGVCSITNCRPPKRCCETDPDEASICTLCQTGLCQ